MKDLAKDPFDELQSRIREMWSRVHDTTAPVPNDTEIIEETDVLILTSEMPDVQREEIRVDVSPSKVVIQTTNPRSANPYRAISLPAEVRPEDAEAHFNNGVLEVVLPKRTAGGVGVYRIPAAET